MAHLINQNVVGPPFWPYHWWRGWVLMFSSNKVCLSLSALMSLALRPMRFCAWRCLLCCWSVRLTTAWRSPSPSWRSVDSNWPRCRREESTVHCSYNCKLFNCWCSIIVFVRESAFSKLKLLKKTKTDSKYQYNSSSALNLCLSLFSHIWAPQKCPPWVGHW